MAHRDTVIGQQATTPDLFDLSDKVAFIAGGYGGIGAVVARGLAERGARVAIAGRRSDQAASAARTLTEAGHVALGLGFDDALAGLEPSTQNGGAQGVVRVLGQRSKGACRGGDHGLH